MRMVDLIEKKAAGEALSRQELQFFIDGFCAGEIPDYQVTALLMAIFLKDMTPQETAELTDIMAHSGGMIDLSAIDGVKVDKHSTGGIGDKTTLVVAPLVAACGGKVAKMSGRALGACGGTIDKLESIPGFQVALGEDDFVRSVNELGLSVISQTADVAPADKKIYALRDVTATIASTPLIASSVMSKKLASGADRFVLEVTVGSGAFVRDVEGAKALAETMAEIGRRNGKPTVALITNMDRPLGRKIGNLLEVQEAAAVLRGEGPKDVEEVCLLLAAEMLYMGEKGSREECKEKAEQALRSGAAYEKFLAFLTNQGGKTDVLEYPEKYYPAPRCVTVAAERDGYLNTVNAEEIGKASMMMGAGRATKEDAIDVTAGVELCAAVGEAVKQGQPLFKAYAQDEKKLNAGLAILKENIVVSPEKPEEQPHIYGRVGGLD
ncbi:MAG: thymidine phosphorylase [Oscillospiraceae bacterium]|nr:thymidine phosphorylase [Oscillospiraceae bacterium]